MTMEIKFKSRSEELQFTRSILQKLMAGVQDPVMVLRPDFTIVDVNAALLESLGLTREEVIGRKCHEVSHRSPEPCSSPLHECPVREVLLKRTSAHALHEHKTTDSITRFYDVVAYPIRDANRNAELILEIWRDISATLAREVEKKASKIKHDLAQLVHEDKMIALGKLVASAVHEVNNPISAIHTFCKVMLRMIKTSGGELARDEINEMEQYLELMSNESKRCGEIVSNLLSFSRHQMMDRRKVDFNEIIEKILLLLKHKMELQNITLSIDLLPDLPYVLGDLDQLQQVIMNLVFNAMEAMPKGGELYIHTCFDIGLETVIVEVRDSGCGISEENQSRVFEPFFSTKSDGNGVGLGLAVVYGIIKEHKGTIEFHSEEGKGTHFRTSFPGIRPGEEA
ncbi:MAG: nitrogen regulation protein NR(II) [Syntrophobacteraceae bacterium]